MRIVFACVFVLSLALVAQGQQLPNYPIIIGDAPVIVVPSVGLDIQCPTCYQPGTYYSGGWPAVWTVDFKPWFRLSVPDWITYEQDPNDPFKVTFRTKCNDGAFRDGLVTGGGARMVVLQEMIAQCPEGQ